jgi:transcriptional regulator with XRE-family HTH domain
MAATRPYISNQDFAEAIEISNSMASRIRSGGRMPSAEILDRIASFYEIPLETLFDARRQGREAFGRWLRDNLLGDTPATAARA